MNCINSVKNYDYSFLVKEKAKKLKSEKNGQQKVSQDRQLYILLSRSTKFIKNISVYYGSVIALNC